MKHEEVPPHLSLGITISLISNVFFVIASSLVWSFRQEFSTVQILFIQNAVCFLATLPWVLKSGVHHLKTKIPHVHFIRDLAGVVSYFLYFVAIRYTNLVDATTLNYAAPFFVPLFWYLWMKERVRKNVWWSVIVGFIGVFIILNPSKQIFQLGFLFGLGAGMFSALAFCAIRILNVNLEPTRRTLFYYFLFGSVVSFPFALVYWIPPSSTQWMKAIGVGVATVLGQVCLTISYRYGTASYLSPLSYATVIYAGLISYFLFDRPIHLQSILGTILIVLGGTATYLLKKKPRTLAQTFESPNPKEKPPL